MKKNYWTFENSQDWWDSSATDRSVTAPGCAGISRKPKLGATFTGRPGSPWTASPAGEVCPGRSPETASATAATPHTPTGKPMTETRLYRVILQVALKVEGDEDAYWPDIEAEVRDRRSWEYDLVRAGWDIDIVSALVLDDETTQQDVVEGHDGTHGPCSICGVEP